jgi:hypothetical protein
LVDPVSQSAYGHSGSRWRARHRGIVEKIATLPAVTFFVELC